MDKCSHKIESENPLQVCLYCLPCQVELHSVESRDAHEGHKRISFDEFQKDPDYDPNKAKPIIPKIVTGTAHLSGQEIAARQSKTSKLIEEMSKNEIMDFINQLNREIEGMKADLAIAYRGKAKLEISLEGDLINKRPEPKVKASTKARMSAQAKGKETAAKVLGISVEELEKMMREGKL